MLDWLVYAALVVVVVVEVRRLVEPILIARWLLRQGWQPGDVIEVDEEI